jgi:hypothetical protein
MCHWTFPNYLLPRATFSRWIIFSDFMNTYVSTYCDVRFFRQNGTHSAVHYASRIPPAVVKLLQKKRKLVCTAQWNTNRWWQVRIRKTSLSGQRQTYFSMGHKNLPPPGNRVAQKNGFLSVVFERADGELMSLIFKLESGLKPSGRLHYIFQSGA